MVSPGGSATVLYPDGCGANVQPGEVMTITPSSPCVNPYAQQQPPPTQTPEYNPWIIGIGGVLVAAGVGVGIYELTKSTSP